MHGQLKSGYGHVTISNSNGVDEIVIHIDAKHFDKIDISLLCSSFPSKNKLSGTQLFHVDPYWLTNLKKPIIKEKKKNAKPVKKS